MTDWLRTALEHLQQTGGEAVLDSRLVRPGDVFVALPGAAVDGRDFIQQVLGQPRVLVIAEQADAQHASQAQLPVTPDSGNERVLWVTDLRQRLGQLAEALYAVNERALSLVGVTGTNGKTSISHYVAQALSTKGRCGLIGTLGVGLWPDLEGGLNTTPDVLTNHRLLADWSDQQADWAVMEVSSHALDQGRVDGLRFRVALFTHLSRDHLDYHGDMEQYFAAKQKLFDPARSQRAVICTDDRWGLRLAQGRKDSLRVSGRIGGTASVVPNHIRRRPEGLLVHWVTPWGPLQTDTRLIGDFNVANLAVTIGALGMLGLTGKMIQAALADVQPVSGRMQPVPLPNGAVVIIDYAHTPDALEKALRASRHHTEGELHCVFGCGGDRDRGKRPQMAAAAAAEADRLWLTSDNNRSESFASIVGDMRPGLTTDVPFEVIADRTAAIHAAIAATKAGDVIVVAGKGHENYQEDQGVRRPYSDFGAVQQAMGGVA
ncbi:MAG: UDP-N-acetylmuramoyl-L-alanyl-D-glutamate--2,6-diaminopimelate ligase [Natronospirillum sp.]|uniref:UDP-N-acetylmuramoyl-L-alanyl-D-glutamate--2, 6-diaminopimelate ligase n=1 Tax=Natronospirillum sp. TaxID=2812955 RepID=UPI0025F0BAD3|nr:UDP-N-acetylmuramoyl-L-alanyl-D-glutamate--2,6-diaminopimelate ligase [Natronospirillum sp.]MCH8551330.1 UDP-N-acetylmuramoyl-L-alanyl-D-glutamate--2,6-diaminopimelate ligase [Natronospirillum sp.]